MTARLRVRGLRPRLMLVVAMGAAVTLGLLTAAFNIVLDARLDRDANDLLRQRASAHLATLDTTGGRLHAPEAPDDAAIDSPIWVFAGRRALERPGGPAVDQRAAAELAGGPRRFRQIDPADTRLYAVPIVAGGRRLGTLVTAASLAPYERTAHTALVYSLVLAAALLLAIVLAARWAIRAALRPVAAMTAQVQRSSEHDLGRRFSEGEPYDEVTRLAATFDALLARLAASLRRERSFSAEVSHELRTPLAKLAAEADLALRRERTPEEYRDALMAVGRGAAEMARTLDTLLSAARAEADGVHGISDARAAADAAVRVYADDAGMRDIRVEVEAPPQPVKVGAEAAAVERVLLPLIENGCRYAKTTVKVNIARVNGEARLAVLDDGPGVPEAIRGRLFEPGVRDGVRDGDHPGAGLGLALSRRLARALQGDVDYVPGPGGAEFRVRLPGV